MFGLFGGGISSQVKKMSQAADNYCVSLVRNADEFDKLTAAARAMSEAFSKAGVELVRLPQFEFIGRRMLEAVPAISDLKKTSTMAAETNRRVVREFRSESSTLPTGELGNPKDTFEAWRAATHKLMDEAVTLAVDGRRKAPNFGRLRLTWPLCDGRPSARGTGPGNLAVA